MASAKEAFGSVSVVIPAYNAQRYVDTTLRSVFAYLQASELDHEVIVVDDGSTDATASLVRRFPEKVTLLTTPSNRGKGHAVRRGLGRATRPWALFMDVDDSTTLDHLDRFAQVAAGADVLIASRRLRESNIVKPQPRFRQLMGRTFPYLVRSLTLRELSDTQCGFKVFRSEVLKQILPRLECDGFCFDVEALLSARRLGYRITEVPVDWDNPGDSTVRLGLDPAKMAWDLLRIVWRHRPARYG